MNNEEEYLQKGAELIRAHEISLTEEEMLDLLQIKYRWPEPAIEVINQVGNTSNGFFDQRKFLIYERWKRLYDLGFTTLMSNVMDLTSELRSLDDKLYEYKGSETNANLYFSSGTTIKRPSFDPHNHDYHVIVKPIYGSCVWEVNGEQYIADPDGVLILPSGTMHSVVENREPRLSLTINMSG